MRAYLRVEVCDHGFALKGKMCGVGHAETEKENEREREGRREGWGKEGSVRALGIHNIWNNGNTPEIIKIHYCRKKEGMAEKKKKPKSFVVHNITHLQTRHNYRTCLQYKNNKRTMSK